MDIYRYVAEKVKIYSRYISIRTVNLIISVYLDFPPQGIWSPNRGNQIRRLLYSAHYKQAAISASIPQTPTICRHDSRFPPWDPPMSREEESSGVRTEGYTTSGLSGTPVRVTAVSNEGQLPEADGAWTDEGDFRITSNSVQINSTMSSLKCSLIWALAFLRSISRNRNWPSEKTAIKKNPYKYLNFGDW